MKKKFYVGMIILVIGCVSEPKVPKGLMTRDEMISFLIKVHILEAEISQLRVSRDSARIVFRYFEDRLKTDHNIDDSLYLSSLEFYYAHPSLMEEVYSAVLDSLGLYERMSEGNEKIDADSVSKAN